MKERFSRREDAAKPRVLRDHRAARGEIGGAAVAEPAGTQPDVLILGDCELGSRVANVIAVPVEVRREVKRVPNPPAATLEQFAVLVRVARECELEPASGQRRE